MMGIFLGNTQFNQVEERLGFKLSEDDKELWNEFHCDSANLSEKESCFHVFHMPACIQFKGEKAKNAILKMFTSDKIVKKMGPFPVYEKAGNDGS